MFPNQIQANEDVVGIIELVYPKALYAISPSMEPNTREKWVFFSLPWEWLGFVTLESQNLSMKNETLTPKNCLYRFPYKFKWFETKLSLGHLI